MSDLNKVDDMIHERFTMNDKGERKIKSMKCEMTELGKLVFYRTYSRQVQRESSFKEVYSCLQGDITKNMSPFKQEDTSKGSPFKQEDWSDVVIRVINGIMSIRKDWMIKHRLPWMNEVAQQSFALEMATSMFDGQWLPAGRGIWACGTDFMRQRGSAAMNNCGACTTKDLELAVAWTMDMLMCGCGVGFDTVWRGEVYAPDKSNTFTFIVPDSREGWVESTRLLVHTYLTKGSPFPIFDYSLIRPPGAPLKTFGGTASGPDPLIKLHKRIQSYFDVYLWWNTPQLDEEGVYDNSRWKALFYINRMLPQDCIDGGVVDKYGFEGLVVIISDLIKKGLKTYGPTRLIADIFNAIGCCVVAGNIRRSSQIALGSVDDLEFINLKNMEINPERIAISWMSNNSIVLKETKDFEQLHKISDLIRKNGEPGVVNLINIQRYGRIGHHHEPEEQTKELKRDLATLCNPCGEIPLESFELCNLVEIFLPRCLKQDRSSMTSSKSYNEGEHVFLEACKYAHFFASTVSLLPTHWDVTNKVVAKNRRIGVSISGYANVYDDPTIGSPELVKLQRRGYKLIRSENERLASEAGISDSIRVTTVKPSGTISLLFGVAPGMHFPTFRYCIRRIRMAANSPMTKFLLSKGLQCVKDTSSDNTVVFAFPLDQSHGNGTLKESHGCGTALQSPNKETLKESHDNEATLSSHGHTRSATEVNMWEQYSIMSRLQAEWSDNMVSATIYFSPSEASEIGKALTHFAPLIKCVSMLPHTEQGAYDLMPYEGITKEVFDKMSLCNPIIDWSEYTGSDGMLPKYCDGEKCEL